MPDPERFPNGFQPISANAKKYGALLLVWFEPERVTPGSWLDTHHPEWLLREEGNTNRLLNLGNPACRQWLNDHVCQLIQENGIGIYRQDFNFEPLRHWRDNDAPDRQGMNENLHVQGYLQYWDDLLRRNPGLWIDSCSSGGRRNDLETMRRSAPLHYTDYGYGIHPIKLAFHHTLYQWIPYFKECTLSWDQNKPGEDSRWDRVVDSFSYHCGLATMLFPIIDIRRDDYDLPLAKKLIGMWRKAAEYLLWGDYYPLTPSCRQPDRWVAWQFDRPENGDGLLQAIRLADCPEGRFTGRMKGLDPSATYLLENPESGEILEMPASVLLDKGFSIELPARSGAIWFYHRKVYKDL
jgi:alpha-galactosidase